MTKYRGAAPLGRASEGRCGNCGQLQNMFMALTLRGPSSVSVVPVSLLPASAVFVP